MTEELMSDLNRRMTSALDVFQRELTGLRTGRASASLLEPLIVEAYGSRMPMTQVGNINVPEARLLTVQVWDAGLVKSVEKAIRESGLGLNPAVDGQLVRVPLPELNQERRQELTKIASKYAEQSRVAIRQVRRDGMDSLKEMEKKGDISEDDHKTQSGEVQTLTDDFIKKIDVLLTQKEKDILAI